MVASITISVSLQQAAPRLRREPEMAFAPWHDAHSKSTLSQDLASITIGVLLTHGREHHDRRVVVS